jgi:hypothetical protein
MRQLHFPTAIARGEARVTEMTKISENGRDLA